MLARARGQFALRMLPRLITIALLVAVGTGNSLTRRRGGVVVGVDDFDINKDASRFGGVVGGDKISGVLPCDESIDNDCAIKKRSIDDNDFNKEKKIQVDSGDDFEEKQTDEDDDETGVDEGKLFFFFFLRLFSKLKRKKNFFVF